MENKMKTYLGIEYQQDNHLLNWVMYWRRGENTKIKSENGNWKMIWIIYICIKSQQI